jgi:Domain of unknown function (DUF4411)
MAKLPYWLDANIFIEANNTFFNIEIAPSFWSWLETQLKAGVLRSSSLVYGEVLGKDDMLAKWARVRKGDVYWPEPDGDVQAAYREIAEYVDTKYKDASPAKVGDFLAKADCWIIAHALAKGGTVVTRESKVVKTSQTPKVPNVCEKFEVPFIQTFDLLKLLKFKL